MRGQCSGRKSGIPKTGMRTCRRTPLRMLSVQPQRLECPCSSEDSMSSMLGEGLLRCHGAVLGGSWTSAVHRLPPAPARLTPVVSDTEGQTPAWLVQSPPLRFLVPCAGLSAGLSHRALPTPPGLAFSLSAFYTEPPHPDSSQRSRVQHRPQGMAVGWTSEYKSRAFTSWVKKGKCILYFPVFLK